VNFKNTRKMFLALGATLALAAVAMPFQFGQVLKVVGVGAAVRQFGGEINRAMNNLSNHRDSRQVKTKVVPILTVGIGASSAIGAAQVMGPPHLVDQVQAVAQPEAHLFGREVRIRALIPVSSQNVVENIRRVDGVGISGIVDLKL
jgi:hypothetical protein